MASTLKASPEQPLGIQYVLEQLQQDGVLSAVDKAIRKLINTTNDLQLYHDAAEKQGMRNLRLSGAQKVANGLTTLEEIYSVVPPIKDN